MIWRSYTPQVRDVLCVCVVNLRLQMNAIRTSGQGLRPIGSVEGQEEEVALEVDDDGEGEPLDGSEGDADATYESDDAWGIENIDVFFFSKSTIISGHIFETSTLCLKMYKLRFEYRATIGDGRGICGLLKMTIDCVIRPPKKALICT